MNNTSKIKINNFIKQILLVCLYIMLIVELARTGKTE